MEGAVENNVNNSEREENLNIEIIIEESANLLIDWGMDELLDDFLTKRIDLNCFKIMTLKDVDDLIPKEKMGLRIRFRHNLIAWRIQNVSNIFALAFILLRFFFFVNYIFLLRILLCLWQKLIYQVLNQTHTMRELKQYFQKILFKMRVVLKLLIYL